MRQTTPVQFHGSMQLRKIKPRSPTGKTLPSQLRWVLRVARMLKALRYGPTGAGETCARALSLALPVMLLLAGCQSSKNGDSRTPAPAAKISAPTKEAQAAMTPEAALAELKAGNARFVAGHPLKRNLLEDVKATASGQYPVAVVLSCLDSRQPIEIVLDQGIGDIFSARVAGNVVNDDILGSLEYACKVSGAKLIAVIGHSNCGAIKGEVDRVELGNLTGLLNKIQSAINEVPVDVQPRNSKNLQFVDKVAVANVRLVMQQIRKRSPILREMVDTGNIGMVGGMYDLSTGQVHFFPNGQ